MTSGAEDVSRMESPLPVFSRYILHNIHTHTQGRGTAFSAMVDSASPKISVSPGLIDCECLRQ